MNGKPGDLLLENQAAIQQIDKLLLPFLLSADEGESRELLEHLVSEQAESIIRGVVRSKLSSFLNYAPHSSESQDVEDVYGEILIQLLTRILELKNDLTDNPIRNLRSYVAVISYNACNEYLRKKYPKRYSLKNKLRYLITRQAKFALWQADDKDLLCGFADWTDQTNAQEALKRFQDFGAGPGAIKQTGLSNWDAYRKTLAELVDLIFNKIGSPIKLDDLVSLVAALLGIRDHIWQGESKEEDVDHLLGSVTAPQRAIETELEERAYLQRVWAEICQLPLWQRMALLLNLRDSQGDDLLVVFTSGGIASLREIAKVLNIPAEHLAVMWNELPLNDAAIAGHLGTTRQQVINLRKSARERLARRLKAFEEGR